MKRGIEEKLDDIRAKKKQLYSVTESKSKEVLTLKTILKDVKKQEADLVESIAAIDARRAELVKNCGEKKKNIAKLEKKINRAEDSNMKTLNNFQDVITSLQKEVEELELKGMVLHPTAKRETTNLPNQQYLESISLKISSKEAELECPVCLELASAPIYMCLEQHLVCRGCRPKHCRFGYCLL